MSSDTTGANIDGAENTTVGKGNVQQVVRVGDGDNEHTATIRLVYELVSTLSVKIDAEHKERTTATEQLRHDLEELRRIAHQTQQQVEGLLHRATGFVTINGSHRTVFGIAFLLLTIPMPLYYSDVRDHVGVSWQFALMLALLCYALSAVAWSYMWWGRN